MMIAVPTTRLPLAKGRRGFTLIELMIAVAVIAILAAIAYPSYQDSIQKSRRSEAFTEVSRIQQAQEKHRANNTAYSTDLGSLGIGVVNSGVVTASYNSTYYTLTVATASATAYTVRATARAGTSQASDTNCQCLQAEWSGADATYTAGATCASATAAQGASCWRR